MVRLTNGWHVTKAEAPPPTGVGPGPYDTKPRDYREPVQRALDVARLLADVKLPARRGGNGFFAHTGVISFLPTSGAQGRGERGGADADPATCPARQARCHRARTAQTVPPITAQASVIFSPSMAARMTHSCNVRPPITIYVPSSRLRASLHKQADQLVVVSDL